MSRVGRSASMSVSSTGQPNNGPRILKEGVISLKGFWLSRQKYVTLTPSELLVCDNKGEDAKQRVELSHATVKPDKDHLLFLVEFGTEKLTFKCATPEERQSWLRVISDTIDHAKAQYQQQVFNQLQQLQGGGARANMIQSTPLPSTAAPYQPSSTSSTSASNPSGPSSSSSSSASASASASSSSSSSGSNRNTSSLSASSASRKPARQVSSQTQTSQPPSQPVPVVRPQTHYNPQYPSSTATPLPPIPSAPHPVISTSTALSVTPPSTTHSSTASYSSPSSSSSSSTQNRPFNSNPHGAVFPESQAYPSTTSSTPMAQTAVFDASVLALMPEVRELFQPVQRWQPPVPESLKLRVDRDPKVESYIEKYKELYPELCSDSTFTFPDQENVCQQMSTGAPRPGTTPGAGAQRGGTTTSDILSAAAAGYPGAYQAAQPQVRQSIGVGQRRRGASVAPAPTPYYYSQQPYAPQPMARQPTTYVSYSRY